MPATEVLVEGLDHPEGVAWDPATGVLWAGGEDGQLYRVDVGARTWQEAPRAPGFVLGLAVDGRSRLAICCSGTGALCVLAQGLSGPPKLVYFMTIDNAKFRKPVVPGDTVEYHVRKIRRRSNIWKFAAEAKVAGVLVAEAEVSAMLVDG